MRTPSPSYRYFSSRWETVAAQAHAFLDHASPLVGSTVARAPHEVVAVVHAKSGAGFQHGRGDRRQAAPASIRARPQVSGNTMRVGLKALGPGTYHVHWHALSVDTHTTEGSFTFQVGGP